MLKLTYTDIASIVAPIDDTFMIQRRIRLSPRAHIYQYPTMIINRHQFITTITNQLNYYLNLLRSNPNDSPLPAHLMKLFQPLVNDKLENTLLLIMQLMTFEFTHPTQVQISYSDYGLMHTQLAQGINSIVKSQSEFKVPIGGALENGWPINGTILYQITNPTKAKTFLYHVLTDNQINEAYQQINQTHQNYFQISHQYQDEDIEFIITMILTHWTQIHEIAKLSHQDMAMISKQITNNGFTIHAMPFQITY